MTVQNFYVAGLVTLLCMMRIESPSYASSPRTPADDVAFSEHLKANAEIDFIDEVFRKEAQRLTSYPYESPSPEVSKLADSTSVRRPKLSDVSVPLHVRLAERERLHFVSSIRMIRESLRGTCPEQIADVTRFADVVVRAQELQRIQCVKIRRTLYQRGTHEEGLAQERSIIDLKLPPYTEENMLSRQRARNKSQDEELAATFRRAEAVDGAVEEFVRFLDSHAQSMRMIDGRFVFANEADAATFTSLQNNVLKRQREDRSTP